MTLNPYPSPRRPKRKWVPLVAAAAILVVGIMIGGAGHATPPPAKASPAPTVFVTSPPKVETKTVTVETVPQACIDALDRAAQVNAVSVGFTTAVQDHMSADARLFTQFSTGDFSTSWYEAKQSSFTDTVSGLADRLNVIDLASAEAQCRSAAK